MDTDATLPEVPVAVKETDLTETLLRLLQPFDEQGDHEANGCDGEASPQRAPGRRKVRCRASDPAGPAHGRRADALPTRLSRAGKRQHIRLPVRYLPALFSSLAPVELITFLILSAEGVLNWRRRCEAPNGRGWIPVRIVFRELQELGGLSHPQARRSVESLKDSGLLAYADVRPRARFGTAALVRENMGHGAERNEDGRTTWRPTAAEEEAVTGWLEGGATASGAEAVTGEVTASGSEAVTSPATASGTEAVKRVSLLAQTRQCCLVRRRSDSPPQTPPSKASRCSSKASRCSSAATDTNAATENDTATATESPSTSNGNGENADTQTADDQELVEQFVVGAGLGRDLDDETRRRFHDAVRELLDHYSPGEVGRMIELVCEHRQVRGPGILPAAGPDLLKKHGLREVDLPPAAPRWSGREEYLRRSLGASYLPPASEGE